MIQPHYFLKYLFITISLIIPILSKSQIILTQTHTNAIVGLDRKNWNNGSTVIHSQGYAHDFTLPAAPNPCSKITSIQVSVNITNFSTNHPPGCNHTQLYYNIFYDCNPYPVIGGGASCAVSNLIGEPFFPPGTSLPTQTYGCPLPLSGQMADFGGNFSVDIIPVYATNCNPDWQNAVTLGFVSYEYEIVVTVNISDISCSGTGCLAGTMVQACDDNNACTINDVQTILSCDNSVCVPCMGTPISAPQTPIFTQLPAICEGGTFTLPTTSTNGISGTWSPAENNTTTTTYTFTPNVTLFPCALETMMTVVVNDIDDATFSINNFCAPTSAAPFGIITPGGAFSFDPAPGDGATINPTSGIITNAVGGTTYSVKYTTSGVCPDEEILTVMAISGPSGTLSGNGNLCPGECANFSFVFTSGTPPFTISLSAGGFPLPPIPGISAASTFTVCYTGSGVFPTFDVGSLTVNIPTTFTGSTSLSLTNISDGSGCPGSASGSYNITLNAGPTAINPGSLSACADIFGNGTFDLTLYNNVVNGGNGSLVVSWYEDMAGTILITNPAAYISSGGTIYVGVSNGNCDSPLLAVTLVVETGVVPFISMLCGSSALNVCDLCVQQGDIDLVFNFNNGDTYDVVVRDMTTLIDYNGSVSNGVPLTVPVTGSTTFQLISIQNLTGCPNNTTYGDIVTVNVINEPIIDPISITPSCLPVTLPTITGSFLSGGEMYYTGQNGTGTSYNAGDVISSSQTLYIYDENAGCDDEEILVITINPLVIFDPIPVLEACGNAFLPAITGVGVGSNAFYNTNITGTGMSFVPGSIVTDSITLYVFDPDADANCIGNAVVLEVNINPLPASPFISNITCNGTLGSFLVLNPIGSEFNYTLDALLPQTSNVYSNIASGTHTMLVTNTITNCESSIPFSINCDCATPAIINLPSLNGSVCEGDTFSLENITFGGAANQVNISTNGTGVIITNTSSITPFNVSYIPSAADVNNVVVLTFTSNDPDGAGPCTPQIVTFPLTVRNNPTGSVIGDEEVCIGSDVTLIATGGVGYIWSNGGSTNDTTMFMDITSPSTYFVTITDVFGCRDTTSYLVDVFIVNAGRDTTLEYCKSSVTTVDLFSFLSSDAQGGGIWKNGSDTILNSSNYLITNLPVGFTSLFYIVDDLLCGRDTALITVEMRDFNNAGMDNTLTVCEGTLMPLNLTLALGVFDIGGTWQNAHGINLSNPSSVNISTLLPGDYLVTYIIADNGCLADTAFIEITINLYSSAGSDVDISSCVGSSINILDLVNTTDKTGIIFNPNNNQGLNGSTWNTAGLQSGVFTFYYVLQNDLPCPNDTSRIDISLQNALDPGMNQIASFCEGETIDLKEFIDVNADLGGVFYFQNQLIANGIITPTGAGSTFVFTYEVGDGLLCPKNRANITMTKVAKPTASILGFDEICEGSCNILTINQSSGVGASIFISGSSLPSGTSFSQEVISSNPSGNTDINICVGDSPSSINQWPANETVTFQIDSILVSGAGNCVFEFNTDFSFQTLPPLQLNLSPILCQDDTFTIGGEVFSSSRTTGIVKVSSLDDVSCDTIYNISVTYYPRSTGVYTETFCDETKTVEIGDEIFGISRPNGSVILANESINGCDSTVTVQLTFTDFIVFDTIVYGCDVEEIRFTLDRPSHSGPYDVLVNGTLQATIGSLPYTTSLLPGNNTVTITTQDGCTETIDLVVDDVYSPEVTLSQMSNVDGTTQLIVLAPNTIYDLTWSPESTLSCNDCLDPIALPLVTTTYSLAYFYGDGCNDSRQITVEVKENVTVLPNIFSPNGDGSNDVFKIALTPDIKQIKQFLIFDRWGSKVFSQSNIVDDSVNFGWNGSFNGNVVLPGVYVYYYEIEYLNGKVVTNSNTLTLVK
jgi:gliding motility-associated-like protein